MSRYSTQTSNSGPFQASVASTLSSTTRIVSATIAESTPRARSGCRVLRCEVHDGKGDPRGLPPSTPYLIVDGANAAIDFYPSVLGATERMRMSAPGNKVGHAELESATR